MPRGIPKSGLARQRTLSPEEARERRERLHAQLRELEQQDVIRYAAIGRAVEKEAESDPKLAEELRSILERNVTDRGERMCLGLATKRRGGRPRKAASSAAGGEAAVDR